MGMARALVEHHGGEVPNDDGGARRAPRRRPEDRERRPWTCARRSRAPGGSPRPARRQSNRHRQLRGSRRGRASARQGAPASAMDQRVRHVDSSRPAHLQAETVVRALRRPRGLRLLPEGRASKEGAAGPCRNACEDPQEVRPALSRAGLGRQGCQGDRAIAGRRVSRDRARAGDSHAQTRAAGLQADRRRNRPGSHRQPAAEAPGPTRQSSRATCSKSTCRPRSSSIEASIPLRVAGNLPYNISSPILFRLLRLQRAAAAQGRDAHASAGGGRSNVCEAGHRRIRRA